MKKALIIASALLLLGAGCAQPPATPPSTGQQTAPSPSANAPAQKGKTPDVRTVIYTKAGKFDPAPVAIHVGGTVTWKNESNNSVWVASTPYPTHTDYPGFDSKAEIPAGKEWSYKFDKAGTWLYINHLEPGTQGRVDVTPWP